MRLFIQRLKRVGIIVAILLLVVIWSFWMVKAIWWFQDWTKPEWLITTVMWVLLIALGCLTIKAIWEIGKGLYTLINWLFVEPFEKR
jgi:hypothetical protein